MLKITIEEGNPNYKSIDNVVYTADGTKLCFYSLGKKLGTFVVPSAVTEINVKAFYNDTTITEVVLPDNLAKINDKVFYKCPKLTTLNIPGKVTTLGGGFISGCTKLTNLTINSENKNYKIIDGVIFSYDEKTLLLYPNTLSSKTYEIPSTVESVSAYAFSLNTMLEEIKFPEESIVKNFGADVFYNSTKLKKIEFPKSATSFKNETFYGCSGLEEVKLSEDITELPYRFFSGCVNLKAIDLPYKIKTLGGDVFVSCKSLTELILPPNLETLGSYCIYTCSNLTEVVIPNKVKTLSTYAIYNNAKLHKLEVSSGTTLLGYYAISSCEKLDTICIKNATPPTVKYDSFVGKNFNNKTTKLLVPCGSLEAYKEYTTEEELNVYSEKFDLEEMSGVNFNKLEVGVLNGVGGTAEIEREASCGVNPIIKATPDEGYSFVSWNVGDVNENPYTFDLTEDMKFIAEFEQITYYSYFESDPDEMILESPIPFTNGKITMSEVNGNFGDEITIGSKPDKGYKLTSLSVAKRTDETSVTVTDGKFTMPSDDITIGATFGLEDYTITIPTATNGSVSCKVNDAVATTANYAQTVTLVVSLADNKYKLASLSITDEKGTEVHYDAEKLQFTMPASNVTITATFEAIDYTVQVGGTFEVGDFKYKVTNINPNKVTAAAKSSSVSGELTLLANVTYLDVTYEVIGLTANGFADCQNVTSLTIDRQTPPTLGENALNLVIVVKVPCGYKSEYEDSGYTNQIESISEYEYKVTATTDGNGTANITKQADCDDHSISVKANPNAGYQFKQWNDGSKVNPYTNNNLTENLSIKASFEAINYTISKNAATNGSFTVSATSAIIGNTITITPTANTGYKVGTISVKDAKNNAVTVNTGSTITFTMPASNVTVSVEFDAIDYSVNVSAVTNGKLSVDKSIAHVGDVVTITSTPNKGCSQTTLKVVDAKGQNVTINSENEFIMPASNVIVSATYTKNTYSISVDAAENGTVNVSKTSANYNAKITITATPIDGRYAVESIVVTTSDKKNVIVKDNAFDMPDANVTVTVKFAKVKDFVNGTQFTIGDFIYTVTDAENLKVSVAASKVLTGEVTLPYEVRWQSKDFDVVGISDEGFLKCTGITKLIANTDDAPTLGTNSFPSTKIEKLQVPCGGKDSFVAKGYNTYFKAIDELYSGYTITVEPEDVNKGTVTITRQPDCGVNPIVEAVPNIGYKFVKWSDDINSNPYTVSLNANTDLIASFAKVDYYIDVNDYQNGKVEVANSANYNDEVAINITPNEGYNYSVTIINKTDDKPINFVDGKIIMPASDVSLTVTFTAIEYNINVVEPENGTITVKATGHVGERVSVETKASKGYKRETLVVKDADNKEYEITNGNFTMPAKDVSVSASFSVVYYSINVTTPTNGSIYASLDNATYGQNVTLEIEPNDGYILSSLSIQNGYGQPVEYDDEYSFDMPDANVYISAEFEKKSTPTSVDPETFDSIEAYGATLSIVIKSSVATDIEVTDISGRTIWTKENAQGNYRVAADHGVYFVRYNGQAKKVIVK